MHVTGQTFGYLFHSLLDIYFIYLLVQLATSSKILLLHCVLLYK